MKRLLPLLLVFALLSPAVAAEESEAGFSDVPSGCWYEDAVNLCAEKGIMVGTGKNTFSPDKTLTRAECLTLALRLYDLQHGGNGVLTAPGEEWGKFVLTTQDGTEISGYHDSEGPFGNASGAPRFCWASYRHGEFGYLNVNLTDEQADWAKTQDGPATLTVNGQSYSGTVNCWYPNNWALSFYPEEGTDSEAGHAIHDTLYTSIPGPDKWWRTAFYYGVTAKLNDAETAPGLAWLMAANLAYSASRQEFALALADVAGDLPALWQADIPDLEREGNEAIFRLYNAGILSGIDDAGTFAGQYSLSRAEAAAMIARVLDETQRVTDFSPSSHPWSRVELVILYANPEIVD